MPNLLSFINAEHAGNLALWMLSMICSLMVKDVMTDVIIGIRIYLSRDLNPGDWMYVDGKLALMISQDFRKTIFQVQDERGTTWRYVLNTKFSSLAIEKIVKDEPEDKKEEKTDEQ